MNVKRVVWNALAVFGCIVLIANIAYQIKKRVFPSKMEQEVRKLAKTISQRSYETTRDIAIKNDTVNPMYAQLSNGEISMVEPGGLFSMLRGNGRVYVPEKNGWYSIRYPFPYSLAGEHEGYRVFVFVPLSHLVDSVNAKNIEVMRTRTTELTEESEPLEKVAVQDIKVTFERGEAP